MALGFGFRCGFLGLLHLEIIQERLERIQSDLVTTAPGVVYKVHKTNGEVIELTNPSNLPDPSEIEYMEEPVVNAEIMVTSEFIGSIMELCQERRGKYLGMEYIEGTRALLKYELPLNEIIYDFFDALKSRSRGYASFDYDLKGYERSNLVKLDILINRGSGCPVLHRLCRFRLREDVGCVKSWEGRDSETPLRDSYPGSHRRQGHCQRNGKGYA